MSLNTDIPAEHWIEIVRRKVAALRFGSVQITVHEGRVTQLDSLEKTRLNQVNELPATHVARRSRAE